MLVCLGMLCSFSMTAAILSGKFHWNNAFRAGLRDKDIGNEVV